MNEKFLHYIWQNKLFTSHDLLSSDKEDIEIIDVGRRNTDAGPDFFNAKIKIGNKLWAGNVEIHTRSSEWTKHKHTNDKAYDSVILHVVKEIDEAVFRSNGEKIPQLALHYPTSLELSYNNLLDNPYRIACENKITAVPPIILHSFLSSLLTDRLSDKTSAIENLLLINKNNWEEAFYITLARNFGFGTNSLPFELLAKSIPLSCLGKHKDNLLQLEALLLGQAGFLPVNSAKKDNYVCLLEKEYAFLKAKYNLKPLTSEQWKMLRLRPSNFPTVRIAQFAALVYNSTKLFSKIVEQPELDFLATLFASQPSVYWENHYLLNGKTTKKQKELGKTTIHILLINTVIPFLFAYGKHINDGALQDKALALLEKIPAEKNSVVNEWGRLGIHAKNAYESQALIQLKKKYCDEKKCLRCTIGHKILTS
jgi:hypothetical protein